MLGYKWDLVRVERVSAKRFGRPIAGPGVIVSGPDAPSPLSAGITWASRIMTLGLGFVLPVLAGHFADLKLGIKPVGLLVGMVVGFSVGVLGIVSIAKRPGSGGSPGST